MRRSQSRAFLILSGAALALLLGQSACGERVAGPGPADPAVPAAGSVTTPVRTEKPGPPPRDPPPPSAPYRLVAEVSPGWTAQDIDAQWGTVTQEKIEGSPFALLRMPYDADYDVLAGQLISSGACVTCERNFYVQAPESEQGSIAFYEGDLETTDYQDQEAFTRVRAPSANIVATGAGTLVAIVDTGVDGSHPDLAGFVRTDGWDFVDQDADPADAGDGLDDDDDGTVDEAAGHGTHIAGIVHAVAPDAEILPLRVLDSDGVGTVFHVARAVHWATDAGADAVNLSLGFEGYSRVVEWAVQRARDAGTVVVASAGNDGRYNTTHFPANLDGVMNVAAVKADDLKAPFSNFGPDVTLSAPGVGIISTYLFHGYASWSGTSMAAPFIAGAAAIARETSPASSADGVRSSIVRAAARTDHGGQPYEGLMGAGRVDLLPIVLDVSDR
jgi:subtilisin family serine protease